MFHSILPISGYPTIAISKRRAMRANRCAASAKLARNVSGSAKVPERLLAAAKLLIADSAAVSFPRRCV